MPFTESVGDSRASRPPMLASTWKVRREMPRRVEMGALRSAGYAVQIAWRGLPAYGRPASWEARAPY
jgi:hypothetical protein